MLSAGCDLFEAATKIPRSAAGLSVTGLHAAVAKIPTLLGKLQLGVA